MSQADDPVEEQFAREVLRRSIGAHITQIDDGSQNGMADALFTLPSGVLGALEVTTLGDRTALQSESLASRLEWKVDGSRWFWVLNVGASVRLRELERRLPTIVLACEADDVAAPELSSSLWTDPSYRWLQQQDVTMHGFCTSNRPGVIEVLIQPFGGAVADDLDGLPAWIEAEAFTNQLIVGKIAKLAATGRPEQYLFIRVHQTGMPFHLYDALARGIVPTTSLNAPATLTGLWFGARWSQSILRWERGSGWHRVDVVD